MNTWRHVPHAEKLRRRVRKLRRLRDMLCAEGLCSFEAAKLLGCSVRGARKLLCALETRGDARSVMERRRRYYYAPVTA